MTPVLLLHGALGSQTQLEPIRQHLTAAGREVYSMNFSGHSGEPFSLRGFGIEVFADDVIRFLDSYQISAADIFGYSMGGYVAVWLAHVHPERVGSIITLGTKFDWSVESAANEVRKLNPEKILEKIPAFARILESRHAPNDWKELMTKTAQMMIRLGDKPLLTEEVIKGIKHRIHVCLGDLDDMADKDYSMKVARWFPNGSFRLLENTPHPIEKTRYIPFVDAVG